jgi:phage baseplate assembly protein V
MINPDLLANILKPENITGQLFGVTVGIVTNNQDPDGMGRVKVRFPWLSDENESHWARVLTPMAGAERGLWFLPEVEDEVLVAFEHGRVDFPYVLGALWNGQDPPPESNDDGENNIRMIRSRSGHVIRLDDTDGSEKIEVVDKDEKNSIVIDSAKNTITIEASGDITIKTGAGKLIFEGAGVEIVSSADVKIEASGNLNAEAGSDMTIKGSMVNIN